MHRCLLISEIFCLILEFVQQCSEGERCRDEKLHRRTLASLARTCRAFSAPALDLLWMRLDGLGPLIRILPSHAWAKKHSRFVRMFMGEKHWLKFRHYAVRVRFLRGPSYNIPTSIQHDFFAAVARFPGASLPLLPNLTELVWGDPDVFSVIDSTAALIKYFAGPRVTTISLFAMSWPVKLSARAVLTDLPNLCPNTTSFTVNPRAISNGHCREISDIVSRWSNLRVLHSCALSGEVMQELASRKTLNTLSIELRRHPAGVHLDKLPATIHTFSLEGNSLCCTRYLQTLKGSPTCFRLRVGLGFGFESDMDILFGMLPTRFDTTRLRNLTVSLGSWRDWYVLCSFPLTEPILASLYTFSALITLDLTSICASMLDDAAYSRMARAWPELRSLKVGVSCACTTEKPMASVGAVIEVLTSCAYLETLHIVFDGSIPPPPPVVVVDEGKGQQQGISAEGDEGVKERGATRQSRSWSVSNRNITNIYIGHSPVGMDVDGMKDLASCLRSVMPRLRGIQSRKGLPALAERWGIVERLLVENKNEVSTRISITKTLNVGAGSAQRSQGGSAKSHHGL